MSEEKTISENDIAEICDIPNFICEIIVRCEKKYYNGKEMVNFYMNLQNNKLYFSAIQIMQFINPNLSETAINKMIRKKFRKGKDYIEINADKKKFMLSNPGVMRAMHIYNTKVSEEFQSILHGIFTSKDIQIRYKVT